MRYHGPQHHAAWHGPWDPEYVRRPPGFGFSRWSRLWIPVIISAFVQIPATIFTWDGPWSQGRPGPPGVLVFAGADLIDILIALVGPVALIFARRFPGPVVAVVSAAAAADLLVGDIGNSPPYAALAFAIIGAVVRGARVWAWISVAVGWVLTLTLGLVLNAGTEWHPGRVAGTTFGILIVFGIAEGVRSRKEHFDEYRERAAQRKQSEVQAERVRIARELHDVLAHSLSQINVQAGVGLHLMDKQPEKAAAALASIKESSKNALDEVRSVLGVLRAEDGKDPTAPLVPEPDLSRLDGLAASVTAQGVDVAVSNTAADAPQAVQLAVYRIVQESLTNVVRHAGATRATVDLRQSDTEYVVTVADNGSGATPSREGGGRGLLGMRERAELLGGSLDTESSAEGFVVTARIPRKDTE